MKPHLLLTIAVCILASCNLKPDQSSIKSHSQSLSGTWKLISDKMITKGDTVISYPVKGQNQEMIKLYNNTHFAFFQHDPSKGKTSPMFSAGAGTYTLTGDDYNEHLEYCNAREWENRQFKFKLTMRNDTITQRGLERIDSLNINREIVEVYVRKN